LVNTDKVASENEKDKTTADLGVFSETEFASLIGENTLSNNANGNLINQL